MTDTAAPPSRRLRRRTAGASLILFPLLMAVETAIDPALSGTGEAFYAAATGRAGLLAASGLMWVLIAILLTPAALGIVHQARDRGAALANLGAALFVLAGVAFTLIGNMYLFASSLAGGDRAEMVDYIERINTGWVFGILLFALAMCSHLGFIVLPWAAWRAGLVGVWAPALATVVVVVHFVLPSGFAFDMVTFAALACVFGYLGVRILQLSDAEWDGVRTPIRSESPVPA